MFLVQVTRNIDGAITLSTRKNDHDDAWALRDHIAAICLTMPVTVDVVRES